jgi:outer membrane protein assembly factor BamB
MNELDRFSVTGALYAMTFVDSVGRRLALSVKTQSESTVQFVDLEDDRRVTLGPSWQVNFAPTYVVPVGDNRTVICNDLEHVASRIDSATGRITARYAGAAVEASAVNVVPVQKHLLLTGAFEVLAIDLDSGVTQARYRTIDRTTRAGVTAADGVVVTGTLQQQLVAFERSSGKPLWIRDFPAAPNRLAAPTFVPGESLVIITSMDGSIGVGKMPQ